MGRQVSLHGKRLYIDNDDHVVSGKAFAAGGVNKPLIVMPGSPDVVAVWEDFLDTGGDLAVFSDTGSAAHGQVAGTNGVHRITPAASSVADPSVVVGRQLAWKPNQGPGEFSGHLRMVARVKRSAITGGMAGMFVGFTDVVAAEVPIHDTGAASPIATATDAVGIMFNTDGDTGWVGASVDAGGSVQTTPLDTGLAAGLWDVLEVEIRRGGADTGGQAIFKINGAVSGYIDNPVNISTALTPIVAIYDTGGAGTVDIDYINVSAPRDTGM